MKYFFLALLALSFSGCANFIKRQECDKVNWFEHGQKIALRGQWLNADKMVQECRKAEANIPEGQLDQGFKSGMEKYCSPTGAYSVGRGGKKFSRDLCEGPSIKSILIQHNQGIRDYCAKGNAYQAGASGEKYEQVCPTDLEAQFLPDYRRGRKKFVESQIAIKDQAIRDLEQKRSFAAGSVQGLRSQQIQLNSQRSLIQNQIQMTMAASNQKQSALLNAQLQSLESDLNLLNRNIADRENDLSRYNSDLEKLNVEIHSLKSELPSLDQ